MKILPEFAPGTYSGAWFTLVYLGVNVACLAFFRKGAVRRLTARPELPAGLRAYVWIETQLFFLPMLYAAWRPIVPESPWFRIGSAVFAAGMLAYAVGMINFGRASFEAPIETGMYRFSRHPHYVTSYIAWLGAAVALQSIVIAALWTALMLMMHRTNKIEEAECIKQYGDAYREYMKRVPRYLAYF